MVKKTTHQPILRVINKMTMMMKEIMRITGCMTAGYWNSKDWLEVDKQSYAIAEQVWQEPEACRKAVHWEEESKCRRKVQPSETRFMATNGDSAVVMYR